MLRRIKVIGGSTLVAAGAIGVVVPAYAASSAPTASTPSATSSISDAPKPSSGGHHRMRSGGGLNLLGLTPAVIAKAAGTDEATVKAGRQDGKSLAQIAAAQGVNRTTLLARLDATADAKVSTLINTKPPAKRGKAPNAAMPKSQKGKHHGKGMDGRHWGHGPRGIAGVGGGLKDLAGTLKVTPTELRADLKAGKTLQQIATTHKVSTATLTAAIEKSINTALAKAVDRVPHDKARTTC